MGTEIKKVFCPSFFKQERLNLKRPPSIQLTRVSDVVVAVIRWKRSRQVVAFACLYLPIFQLKIPPESYDLRLSCKSG